ncbi:MAG: vacuolar iron transporter family protein [Sphingomonadales bacterium]|nr:vacuolar iron transporter family protein [Sphingomonadales bacterium]
MKPARAAQHFLSRIGWLRAAVLGANDGIVSIGSLIIGIAAAAGTYQHVLLTGVAGLVAGAMSMTAGEFVSVSSQADSEKAGLAREAQALRADPLVERDALAGVYAERGVEPILAQEVAAQLMARDALRALARDELGISEIAIARPLQAAFASAVSFTAGGAAPLLAVLLVSMPALLPAVFLVSLLSLALLGALGARAGGAPIGKAIGRVAFWGALAMAVTAAAGYVFSALGG